MIKVGSLFSGIGGIDLGFEQAGFEIAWSNDIDAEVCKTYRHNFPNTQLIEGDVRDIDPRTLPDIDVLIAGFPCQPFSIMGYRRGFKDPRGNLFFEISRFIDVKRPRVVFLENVRNLMEHDDGKTFLVIYNTLAHKCERMTTLTAMLDSAGYHTEAWYGGDLLHNNMRAFLYGTGFDNVVDSHKLRVHGVMRSMDDAVVLPLMTERILECEEPFFWVYTTNGMESDHRLPYTKYDDARTNASAFIDDQIGVMVRRLKYGGAWDNLLIVVVGDSDGSEVKVPMMMVGGAVKGFGVVSEIGSQSDIPVTLARQMDLDAEKFPYGADLAAGGQARAYYTYDDGYGAIDELGTSQYHFGQRYVESDPALKMRRYNVEEFLWGAYDELKHR